MKQFETEYLESSQGIFSLAPKSVHCQVDTAANH